MFKKWKGEVEESMDSSDHQEHAQKFIDEVRKTTAHFENSDHHRNKVGKVCEEIRKVLRQLSNVIAVVPQFCFLSR